MSYRLEADETLPQGVRRMACAELDFALFQLTGAGSDRDEAIHEVRKCFKKVRALLRLICDDLGNDVYRRENWYFRDAGRRLSDLRESAAMVETLDKVALPFVHVTQPGNLPPDSHSSGHTLPVENPWATEPASHPFAHLRASLAQAHQNFSRRLYDEEEIIDVTARTLRAARLRVPDWPVTSDDFTAVAGGLQRVYRRGRRRLAGAYASSTPEAFHEWRKEVKYLWYQVTILELLQPGDLQPYTAELHDLSDYLGNDHDLAVLRRTLQQRPELLDAPGQLPSLVERRRAEIEAAARPLGQRLYAEEPDAFVRRISAYWEQWQRKT